MESTVVILFTIDPFKIGGIEIFTRELARQLEPLGHRLVAVFTNQPTGAAAEYLQAPNLILEAVPELDISELSSIGPMFTLLRRYRPRVLHLNFVSFIGPFPWVARLCGVQRVVFTAHGSMESGQVSRRAPWWKRIAVPLINAPLTQVLCVSEFNRRFLLELDIFPAKRFAVLYNGIQTPELNEAAEAGRQFRERYGIPQDRELVTQVSWIIAEKGIPQLLEAARQVLAVRPKTHFAIVGSGLQAAEYRQRAADLGIAQAVTWTGLVDNPMSAGVYAATDVFCLASQWQEAFGMVLAEAMAFAKPAVGSAVGGIPEVIEDGVTGFLVDPGDAADLAQKLRLLLDNVELRHKMGRAGRRRVEEKFQLEKIVSALLRQYRFA